MTDVEHERHEGVPERDTQRSGRLGLSMVQVAERVRRELVEITGLPPDTVTSLERRDDGTWKVTVELLELSRIPETDDLLGTYEASVDAGGELLAYRRVRRYARSKSLQDQGGW